VTGNAADDKGPLVPPADYPKLVEQSVKVIQEALTGEPDGKAIEKSKVAAVMIAVYAQNGPGSPAERATLRNAALKLSEAIDDEKFADARKLVGELLSLKADPNAKDTPVEIMDNYVFIEEAMGQFKLARAGGLEIERDLLKLGSAGLKAKALPPDSLNDKLMLMAYQTAMAAKLAREYKTDKKQQDWNKYCEEMQKAALDLAGAAKAKDGKAAYMAINKLNASCNDCHEIFR
jgi:hypothetical protein